MSSAALGSLLSGRPLPDETLDWAELTSSAVRERVAAALSPCVRDHDEVPRETKQALLSELYRTGAFNVLLYRELGRILSARPVEEPPVVLKGGALATTVYDDLSHRPMCDLDLLVRRADLEAWAETLEGLGYRRESPEMSPGLDDAVHYQLAFRGGPHDEIVIELHWNLVGGETDWRAPDIDWFWKHTVSWPGVPDLDCPEARQLSPVATLCYASAHAFLQHGGARTRLLWLFDVHRVLSSLEARDTFWHELTAAANTLGWEIALADALEYSRKCFGTDVPAGVVETLRLNAGVVSEEHARSKASLESSRAEHVLRDFRCLDTRGRLRLARAILFPSPTYLKWRYPTVRAVWPLAYLYRFCVVLREGAVHALHMLTRALSFVRL